LTLACNAFMEEEETVEQPTKKQRSPRGEGANALSKEEIETLLDSARKKGMLVWVQRGTARYEKSLYKTTGPAKHGQIYVDKGFKVLIHHIYWRMMNDYALIPADLHISHRDAEPEVMNLIAETVDMNESRKYCHKFGWYKVLPGADRPRCPHWEAPCTGPTP